MDPNQNKDRNNMEFNSGLLKMARHQKQHILLNRETIKLTSITSKFSFGLPV